MEIIFSICGKAGRGGARRGGAWHGAAGPGEAWLGKHTASYGVPQFAEKLLTD
jgi:hypothetical protein